MVDIKGFALEQFNETFAQMVSAFLKVAIPTVVASIIFFIQHLTNMIVAGHLENKEMLAAIGMGNMIQNCFFISPIMGINSAIETLASQAAGAQNTVLAGHYLNQAKIVFFSLFVVMILLSLNAQRFLVMLHQNEEVSRYTQQYIYYYLPGLFFYGTSDILRRFLNSFQKNTLPMISFMISVILHPLWCYMLAIQYGYKLTGIALAGCISNLINFVILSTFFNFQTDLEEANKWISLKNFSGLGSYIQLGVPMLFVCCLDFWAYECMTILSGIIGIPQQAGQVIVMNMAEMSYQIAWGMQSAACTVLGNQIGLGNLKGSNAYLRVILIVSLVLNCVEAVVVYRYRHEFLGLMTDLADVKQAAYTILIYFAINVFLEGNRGVIRGVIKAMGLQHTQIAIAIIAQWVVAPCLMYYFIFVCQPDGQLHPGLGLSGIWISKLIIEVYINLAYLRILYNTDMQAIIDETRERFLNDDCHLR